MQSHGERLMFTKKSLQEIVVNAVCLFAAIFCFVIFYKSRDWYMLLMGIAFVFSIFRYPKKTKTTEE